MKRIHELIEEIKKRPDYDNFFSNFEHDIKLYEDKKRYYMMYDRAVSFLDDESWRVLKQKAINHYPQHRDYDIINEIRKESFFNILNEAFAYRYLAKKGCSEVKILKEGKSKIPDISFSYKGKKGYCEVKNINPSQEYLKRITSMEACDGQIYFRLNEKFFEKFQDTISSAIKQLHAMSDIQISLIYLIIYFDDWVHDYYENYRKQIIYYCKENNLQNIFIRIGHFFHKGYKRISVNIAF